ncbi:ribbon-helix-helix protein, CopG family [Salinarimonas sp.]|uniref:ribbon-helix-helix protein, CopG family n=1 Tax=Salinarimonas sp. TaxID=2766526 RepID=UPI00391A8626
MTPKKRGRPATGTDPHLSFRSPPEVTEAIERAAKAQTDTPSRSEMIRRIVTEWLRERGHLG